MPTRLMIGLADVLREPSPSWRRTAGLSSLTLRLTHVNSWVHFGMVRAMSAELIGILSAGVALAGLVFRLSARMDGIEDRLASVEQRLARVEGLLEGLGQAGRGVPATGDQAHESRL